MSHSHQKRISFFAHLSKCVSCKTFVISKPCRPVSEAVPHLVCANMMLHTCLFLTDQLLTLSTMSALKLFLPDGFFVICNFVFVDL